MYRNKKEVHRAEVNKKKVHKDIAYRIAVCIICALLFTVIAVLLLNGSGESMKEVNKEIERLSDVVNNGEDVEGEYLGYRMNINEEGNRYIAGVNVEGEIYEYECRDIPEDEIGDKIKCVKYKNRYIINNSIEEYEEELSVVKGEKMEIVIAAITMMILIICCALKVCIYNK